MKLLFPIFASLMLQHQVNTEFIGLRKCLMGLGRCKDHCTVGEKEVQKCKKKKCCAGPKTVQLIEDYLQNEMFNIFDKKSQELLKSTENFRAVRQTKYPIVYLPPKIKSPLAKINTIISNANAVKSATTNPMVSGKITYPATSNKSDSKKARDSATDSPPPAPPP
ncbi:PREDICTED: beta-defensin 129 [Hipposideros armiger]|uniref:Beta-defensin 129 n=1 Tax=Hipposideros armiger TaxID=186990 RepID=A0A8B7RK37_HIPAR|nr:PREDICTED: beta-defensin 129 [Hipposideros armiger]